MESEMATNDERLKEIEKAERPEDLARIRLDAEKSGGLSGVAEVLDKRERDLKREARDSDRAKQSVDPKPVTASLVAPLSPQPGMNQPSGMGVAPSSNMPQAVVSGAASAPSAGPQSVSAAVGARPVAPARGQSSSQLSSKKGNVSSARSSSAPPSRPKILPLAGTGGANNRLNQPPLTRPDSTDIPAGVLPTPAERLRDVKRWNAKHPSHGTPNAPDAGRNPDAPDAGNNPKPPTPEASGVGKSDNEAPGRSSLPSPWETTPSPKPK